jgi:regulatory protein
MNHKITALTVQKRNRQRINVYLDGEFAFGLARITAAWLQVGQEISDEKIAQLLGEDEREVAYQRALKFLGYRPRTEREINDKLREHGFADPIIEYVLGRLQRSGLVDDEQFAKTWVENRNEYRPRSRRALSYELRQRGIDNEVIDETLEDFDDEEMAYQAALQKVRKLKNLEWQEFRQKMYAFLARRGFNYEASAQAVARVWAEQQSDQSNENYVSHEEVDE